MSIISIWEVFCQSLPYLLLQVYSYFSEIKSTFTSINRLNQTIANHTFISDHFYSNYYWNIIRFLSLFISLIYMSISIVEFYENCKRNYYLKEKVPCNAQFYLTPLTFFISILMKFLLISSRVIIIVLLFIFEWYSILILTFHLFWINLIAYNEHANAYYQLSKKCSSHFLYKTFLIESKWGKMVFNFGSVCFLDLFSSLFIYFRIDIYYPIERKFIIIYYLFILLENLFIVALMGYHHSEMFSALYYLISYVILAFLFGLFLHVWFYEYLHVYSSHLILNASLLDGNQHFITEIPKMREYVGMGSIGIVFFYADYFTDVLVAINFYQQNKIHLLVLALVFLTMPILILFLWSVTITKWRIFRPINETNVENQSKYAQHALLKAMLLFHFAKNIFSCMVYSVFNLRRFI